MSKRIAVIGTSAVIAAAVTTDARSGIAVLLVGCFVVAYQLSVQLRDRLAVCPQRTTSATATKTCGDVYISVVEARDELTRRQIVADAVAAGRPLGDVVRSLPANWRCNEYTDRELAKLARH